MFKKLSAIGAIMAMFTLSLFAQTPPVPTVNLGTIQWNGMTLPAIVGTPITVNGQTMLIETNQSGGYTVVTYGPNGTNSITPPTTLGGVGAFVENALQNNNPANASYYSTNGEWDISLGAAYSQNSGQAAAVLEVERYGLIKSLPDWALGLGVLEGNQGGQNGTAAGYMMVDYRHPIGDVAFVGGVFAGYDNYTGNPMGGPKIKVEYRKNAHLGAWTSVAYDIEGFAKTKTQVGTTITDPSGLIISGGLTYAF